MSYRYPAAFVDPGLNTLVQGTPTYSNYTYYLNSWGGGAFGQLGLQNSTAYSSPKQVGLLTDWLNNAGGQYYAAAVKKNGTLWTWGRNNYGQLGTGNTTYNYSSPKQIGSLTTWSSIAPSKGGASFTLAVKTDATLWAWGYNGYGQLGTGNTTDRSSPVQVGASAVWASVATGADHTLAVRTNGTLWSWGYNIFGQLGLNTSGYYTEKSSPTQVGALTNWKQVSAGNRFSIAVKTDGTIWSWGGNGQGQLGLGDTSARSSPNQVGALTTWLTAICGYRHVVAIKTDGTLWTWGYNAYGGLGIGTTTDYSSPKQVGALTTWAYASAGLDYTAATKTDFTLWTWGYNGSGQLGQGNTTNFSSPKQVGAVATWYQPACGTSAIYVTSW